MFAGTWLVGRRRMVRCLVTVLLVSAAGPTRGQDQAGEDWAAEDLWHPSRSTRPAAARWETATEPTGQRVAYERPLPPRAGQRTSLVDRPVYTGRTARRSLLQQEGTLDAPAREMLPAPGSSADEPGEMIPPGTNPERVLMEPGEDYSEFEPMDDGFGYPGDLYSGECWHWCQDLTVSFGVLGFQGPADSFHFSNTNTSHGNFGFSIGVNWGGPLWCEHQIGYQIGWQATRTNLSGDIDHYSGADRTQHFITAGLFHRATCGGLQFGVVFDWLNDDSYTDMSLGQLRAELGLVGNEGREFGFTGAFGTGEDDHPVAGPLSLKFEPLDYYALYFRKRFRWGGEGRLFAGATNNSNGVIGADVTVPLTDCFAVQGDWMYASAKRRGEELSNDEFWGISLNLVWYPGCTARCATHSPWRPLFNVAGNSTFLIDEPNQPQDTGNVNF